MRPKMVGGAPQTRKGMNMKPGTFIKLAFSILVCWLLFIGSENSVASPDVGELGPLIPFHKDAIAAGLAWSPESPPKICFWMRPAEYRGTDLVDPTPGPLGTLKLQFQQLVYGGFPLSRGPHGLDESVTTRIKDDIPRDNALCFALTHPDAFKSTGKYNVDELTADDFAMNAAAFSNAGHSKGLHYNVFCSGQVVLPNGRWCVVGGTDKAGNIGIRKINLFDPVTETWLPRPMPPVKADYLADPNGLRPHSDPLIELNTDPPLPSDMRYRRWYPTAVTLPDGRVLILSGTDEDASLGPAHAAETKVRQAVPEVYDPETDASIPLENARKLHQMYPRAYVVQTGPRRNNWKVAVIGEVEPPLPTGDALRQFDPFHYNGNTSYLDVLSALADPNRDQPAENHWEFVNTASMVHDNGAGAQIWETDSKGDATSQKVVLFGGECGAGAVACDQRTVEMIDFQSAAPQWIRQADLMQPAAQNNAVVLPTGQVLVFGGNVGRGRCGPPLRPWGNSFYFQMFDPELGTITPLVQTRIPRHDHSTGVLLPDGTVITMGGNRTDLANDPCQTGLDKGVPVAQIYKPAYLFKGPRPSIDEAPDEISYKARFVIRVTGGSDQIGSVAIIRIGPVTHNWDWGNRYVRLWFKQKDNGEVIVQAPARPGLAVPGYYMLFVINDEGVPSVAKLVHLGRGQDRGGNGD